MLVLTKWNHSCSIMSIQPMLISWQIIALHNSKCYLSTINSKLHFEPVAMPQCEIQCFFLNPTCIDWIVLRHFSNNLSNISYQQVFKMQNKYMRDLPCLCISKEFFVHLHGQSGSFSDQVRLHKQGFQALYFCYFSRIMDQTIPHKPRGHDWQWPTWREWWRKYYHV